MIDETSPCESLQTWMLALSMMSRLQSDWNAMPIGYCGLAADPYSSFTGRLGNQTARPAEKFAFKEFGGPNAWGRISCFSFPSIAFLCLRIAFGELFGRREYPLRIDYNCCTAFANTGRC